MKKHLRAIGFYAAAALATACLSATIIDALHHRGPGGLLPASTAHADITPKFLFTKCQMRSSGAPGAPSCPAGYTASTSYASERAYCDGGRLGIHPVGVSDGESPNGYSGNCSGGYGLIVCSVCLED